VCQQKKVNSLSTKKGLFSCGIFFVGNLYVKMVSVDMFLFPFTAACGSAAAAAARGIAAAAAAGGSAAAAAAAG